MTHRDVMQATGRPSRPQIGALLARWVHRLERLVEPTNFTAGGVAVWVGLHQLQPGRSFGASGSYPSSIAHTAVNTAW